MGKNISRSGNRAASIGSTPNLFYVGPNLVGGMLSAEAKRKRSKRDSLPFMMRAFVNGKAVKGAWR